MQRFAFLGEPPYAMAHQGGDLEAPGNSMAAFEHSLKLGYRYLETDAHPTKDGVVVLCHDETLDRTTDMSGRIRDLTWAQVSRAKDASGNPPPKLVDVLGDLPDLRLNIDAKEPAVVVPLVRAIRATRAFDRVNVASFDTHSIRRLRRLLGPRVSTSMGRSEIVRLLAASKLPDGAARQSAWLSGLPVPPRAHVASCVQVPVAQGAIKVLTPRFVDLCHSLGLQVHAWTINEEAEMRALLRMGVDCLITDRPTLAIEVLSEFAG